MKWAALLAIALAFSCLVTPCMHAQVVTAWQPVTTCNTPATTAYNAPATTTAYYAPAATTAYYAPAATTAYYAPAATTAYYAPAATTAYYAPTAYPRRRLFPFLGWRLRRDFWQNRAVTTQPVPY
jgi:hypothetical protein